jgi:hypothetical protein
MPEHARRARNVALGQLPADGVGGERLAAVRDLRHHRHAEAQPGGGAAHRLRVAPAPLAKVEVVADHDVAGGERAGDDPLDEVVGFDAGQRRIEGQDDGEVEPEALEQPELVLEGRQAEMRLVRLKELARMRLEQDHAGRCAEPRGFFFGGAQQDLVAAVHAVEIADRQHGASGGRRHAVDSLENDHVWRDPAVDGPERGTAVERRGLRFSFTGESARPRLPCHAGHGVTRHSV